MSEPRGLTFEVPDAEARWLRALGMVTVLPDGTYELTRDATKDFLLALKKQQETR